MISSQDGGLPWLDPSARVQGLTQRPEASEFSRARDITVCDR